MGASFPPVMDYRSLRLLEQMDAAREDHALTGFSQSGLDVFGVLQQQT